jgi:hypothetical protein
MSTTIVVVVAAGVLFANVVVYVRGHSNNT